MGPGTKDSHVTPPARREAMTRKANPVIVGGVVRGTWAVKKGTKNEGNEIAVTWLNGGSVPRRRSKRRRSDWQRSWATTCDSISGLDALQSAASCASCSGV